METSIEKSDFQFHSLQKTRLIPSGTQFNISHDAVCVSSQYQIAVATMGDNKLISFNSSTIHPLFITRHTANKEFSELQKKTVELNEDEKIASLSANCDGTLLGVLTSKPSGSFVYIYDIVAFSLEFTGEVYPLCCIRIGTENDNRGVCLIWNPAQGDTFAASASDRTILTAKVDQKNPSSYSLIASKKMGAVVTHISWSPKGKQLTTGDELGKVCQLKLELEVVRAILPPDLPNASKDVAPVTGLCWISTTEWIVAYAGSSADAFIYLLTIKKDQPPSWRIYPELQYGAAASSVSPCFSFETSLLLSWNLVIISNSKSSEIFVIGKIDDWKVWNLDDETRLDLPTNSKSQETFPLGMCIDLSSCENVPLNEDRMKYHRPEPILFILTTDGILTGHSIVTLDANNKECTIESTKANISAVKVGPKPPSSKQSLAVTNPLSSFGTNPNEITTTATHKKTTSLFGGQAAQPLFGTASFTPQTTNTTSSSLFGGKYTLPATTTTTSSLFGGQASKPLFEQVSSTPITQSIPSQPKSEVKPLLGGSQNLFKPQASSTPVKVENSAAMSETKSKETEVDNSLKKAEADGTLKISAVTTPHIVKVEKENISAEVESVNKVIDDVRRKWSSMIDTLHALTVGIRHAESASREIRDLLPGDDFGVLHDIGRMVIETDMKYKEIESKIGALTAVAGAKLSSVNKYKTSEERLQVLCDTESFDLDEKMKRLTIRIDDTKEEYANAKKAMENCLKQKKKVLKPLPSLNPVQKETILAEMKVVQRWTGLLTTRLDLAEDDIKQAKLMQKRTKGGVSSYVPNTPEIKTIKCHQSISIHGIKSIEAKNKLRNILKEKSSKGNLTKKQVDPEPFVSYNIEKSDESNIFESFNKSLKISPSRTLNSSIVTSRSDASTQIDAPPQIKIIEKEIPVPQPMPVQPNVVQAITPTTPQSFGSLASLLEQKPKTSTPINTGTIFQSPTFTKSVEKPTELSLGAKKETKISNVVEKPPLTAKASVFGEPSTPDSDDLFKGLSLGCLGNSSTLFGTKVETPTKQNSEEPLKKEEDKPKLLETPKKEEPKSEVVLPVQNTPEKVAGVIPANVSASSTTQSPFVTSAQSTVSTTVVEKKPTFSFASGAQSPTTTTSTSSTPAASSFSFTSKAVTNTSVTPPNESPKSSFSFVKTETKSVFGGGSTPVATPEKPAFGVFSAGITAAEKPSIFAGASSAEPTVTNSIFDSINTGKSIFGGGQSSGSFSSPSKPTFSFKQNEQTVAVTTTTTAPTFSFSQKPSGASSGFLAAVKQAAEEGMMEDESNNGGQSGGSTFSFGSMSLGGSSTTPSKSIFGGTQTAQPQEQKSTFSLFSKPQTNSSAFGNFGSTTQTSAKPSIFGGGIQQQQSIFAGQSTTNKSIFGGSTFGQAAAQAASSSPSSSTFNNTAPKFGAAPNFAAAKQSPFGAKPSFGGSAFGGGTGIPPAGGGFAKYAGQTGNLFANAQQQNQQQNQNSSIFQWR